MRNARRFRADGHADGLLIRADAISATRSAAIQDMLRR